MLPPDYFTNKEDRLLELYRQLEDFILKDITRRLLAAGEMTSTADRLIYKLQMMGESREEIQKKLSEMTGLTCEKLRAILQDAVLTSWEEDASTLRQLGVELSNPLENAAVVRVMDAEYKKSLGELTNLTRTTMEQSQMDLINMLDEADLRVASGAQSYSAVVCDILDRYAGKGIEVLYPTGTKRTLEAAVRCCVVTSMNQTAAQVTNQYIVEAKSEYVLVSAHLGARTQPEGQPTLAGHDNWQGKVYRIVGSEPEYHNLLESTGYDIEPGTGIGKVVNPLGLHGYNCRHSHKPWDIRLRNPYVDENGNLKIDSEENQKQYELQQKQRAMERAIRKTKRELVTKQQEIDSVAETDVKSILQEDYDKLAVKLTKQNQAYNDFCKDNNLQPQYDRIKAAGFSRKQEKAAREAEKRYSGSVNDSVPARNIISRIGDVKKRDEFVKTANQINNELDSICVRKSKWSGNIIIDDKMDDIGEKEWNCDIRLASDAGYDTVLHELLHARSVSYYDEDTYARYQNMEEGTVELLSEEICRMKGLEFVLSYEEQVKYLRRINRRAKLYANEYDFAVDLLNIPLVERSKWLVQKISNNITLGLLDDAHIEGALDSLSKLLEGNK